MGKLFYGDEDEYDDISERSVSGKGPSDINTGKKSKSIKNSDTIQDKEKYVNSKLIEFGFYKGEEKAELKDNSSKDLIKINGEFFIKKKELNKEDEMFLKLRTLDILRKSQKNIEEQNDTLREINYILRENIEEQKSYIKTIRNIELFYFIVTISSIILAFFIWINYYVFQVFN